MTQSNICFHTTTYIPESEVDTPLVLGSILMEILLICRMMTSRLKVTNAAV